MDIGLRRSRELILRAGFAPRLVHGIDQIRMQQALCERIHGGVRRLPAECRLKDRVTEEAARLAIPLSESFEKVFSKWRVGEAELANRCTSCARGQFWQ